jgi:hypothetical protein
MVKGDAHCVEICRAHSVLLSLWNAMSTRILDRLLLRCSHQFSWPRKSADGTYYQVCLSCGAQYAYDWDNMRRIRRVKALPAQTDPSVRASRMRIGVAVQYRELGTQEWYQGVTADISQSGVKISGSTALKENAPLEIIFDMPEQIAGGGGHKVACSGRVVRVVQESAKESGPAFAATLSDYHYVPAAQELECEKASAHHSVSCQP